MKKVWRILIGVCSAALLFTGCGQAGESETSFVSSSAVSEPSEVSFESSMEEIGEPSSEKTEESVPESSSDVSFEEASEPSKSPDPSDSPSESFSDPSSTPSEPPEPSSESTSKEPDQYHTNPIPEGKPQPQEPQETSKNSSVSYTCTLTIRCDTILQNMDKFNMDKESVLPSDGVILPETAIVFYEGESVFDVLLRETRERKIHMEYSSTPMYNSCYIEGIHNLYEFDCGSLSGWMYQVNGWFPNYGCSRYVLKDGDQVEWLYTCDLGRDLGCDYLAGGEGS